MRGGTPAVVLAVMLSTVLGGCALANTPRSTYESTTGSSACAAPEASLSPAPVVAGGETTVQVSGALDGCNDQGEGPNVPLDSVFIQLVSPEDRDVVAHIDVPINDDFSGEAALSLESVEPGTYVVLMDGVQVNQIEIVAP